jgi:excisionase family DNA binding protein
MQANPTRDAPKVAFRVDEACAALGISRSQLYVEAAQGRLKILKCGRRSIVPAREIHAWLDRLPEKAA